MKTQLSVKESAKLIELGVSPERASMCESSVAYGNGARGIMKAPEAPVFTLADILDILPKEIEVDFPNADGGIDTEDCYLCTQWCINGDYSDNHQWCVFYTPGFQVVGDSCAKELIDALYKCLIWAIDHNHVKLD